jgi:PhzF family phenazine biosynthesis protein
LNRYHLIDSFTAKPFSGNPAAVVLLAGAAWPEDAWMRGVAAEFNVSETAFVLSAPGFIHQRIPAPPVLAQPFGLRWFTPQVEVALCGHATLATVRALREEQLVQEGQQLGFDTRSGRLTCSTERDVIRMDFPAKAVEPCEAPAGLFEALDMKSPAPVYRDEDYLLVELPSEDAVRNLSPRFTALYRIPFMGVCVTAPAAEGSGAPDA